MQNNIDTYGEKR